MARGDVIVFGVSTTPAMPVDVDFLIKRVAGVAGDSIPEWLGARRELSHLTHIPEGYCIVVGDNAGRSQDSRQLGLVPETSIQAVVSLPARPKVTK